MASSPTRPAERRTGPAAAASTAAPADEALPGARLASTWLAARDPTGIAHLDAAGAARASQAVIAAQVAHLTTESVSGAYVAETAAQPVLAAAADTVADLLGPGLRGRDVVFHYSATTAFATLLTALPLSRGARVGILRSEYGGNAMLLASHAEAAGLELVDLPVKEEDGRVDLDRFDPTGFGLVTFPHVASQRGIVQPVAAVGARCREAGVPLVIDVAQSLGQVDVTGVGAAAYVGTSRKWLCGPRGVGIAAVRPDLAERLRPTAPNLHSHSWAADGGSTPLSGAERVHVGESAVAARVGLATALGELTAAGPRQVQERIAALGAYARRRLDGVAGYRVVEPWDEPSGIVTLRPPRGLTPARTRDRLLAEYGVLTSAIPTARAPRDMTGPVLRASFHAYATEEDVDRIVTGLTALPRQADPAG